MNPPESIQRAVSHGVVHSVHLIQSFCSLLFKVPEVPKEEDLIKTFSVLSDSGLLLSLLLTELINVQIDL